MIRSRFVDALAAMLLAATAMAACASPQPTTQASTATARPTPRATAVFSPSPTPAALPDLSQAQHTGAPLTPAQEGTGDSQIDLTPITTGSHVEVRFACSGPTGVKLTDQDGRVLLGTSGCDSHAMYGSDFTSSASDTLVQITAAPDVSWEFIVFWIMS